MTERKRSRGVLGVGPGTSRWFSGSLLRDEEQLMAEPQRDPPTGGVRPGRKPPPVTLTHARLHREREATMLLPFVTEEEMEVVYKCYAILRKRNFPASMTEIAWLFGFLDDRRIELMHLLNNAEVRRRDRWILVRPAPVDNRRLLRLMQTYGLQKRPDFEPVVKIAAAFTRRQLPVSLVYMALKQDMVTSRYLRSYFPQMTIQEYRFAPRQPTSKQMRASEEKSRRRTSAVPRSRFRKKPGIPRPVHRRPVTPQSVTERSDRSWWRDVSWFQWIGTFLVVVGLITLGIVVGIYLF